MRFFLIDQITAWEQGKRATAIKSIALSEDFFEDHFPLKPIMPGVLILEGMAQPGGLLLEDEIRRRSGQNLKAVMSIVDKAKFRSPIVPGDRLEYSTEILSINEVGGMVAARAQRDDLLIADCTLVFSFFHYDNPRAEAHRAKTLSLWMKGLDIK